MSPDFLSEFLSEFVCEQGYAFTSSGKCLNGDYPMSRDKIAHPAIASGQSSVNQEWL
ncbi:hypothetical protein [Rhodopirellula europaea]|uniref:Uncharacterized protein n=1 Tax=Rhodopirellula europaea 6C TaxID=1263867 RepID=M2AV08_9BACT|nr:hypothetical protein [Rhodopirellula europaea]EMB16522.1 hypothetical protein RE6C_02887 [Rhodopirellula europaea 6C]